MTNPASFYWLECYLFGEVRERFLAEEQLDAFDFFSIIIWKSNRSKSRIARRLLDREKSCTDLNTIVRKLTAELYLAATNPLPCIMGWGFRLPIGSAILTVLWPERFTVFDVRACETLQRGGGENFAKWADSVKYSDRLNAAYERYVSAVRAVDTGSSNPSLRDKDRYLWGSSAMEQLRRDINRGFAKEST